MTAVDSTFMPEAAGNQAGVAFYIRQQSQPALVRQSASPASRHDTGRVSSSTTAMLSGMSKVAKLPVGQFKSSLSPYAKDVCEKHRHLPRPLMNRIEYARPTVVPYLGPTGSSSSSKSRCRSAAAVDNVFKSPSTSALSTNSSGFLPNSSAMAASTTLLSCSQLHQPSPLKSNSLSSLPSWCQDDFLEEEFSSRLKAISSVFEKPRPRAKPAKLSAWLEERARPRERKLQWPPLEHRLAMPLTYDGQAISLGPPRKRDLHIPEVPARVLDRWAEIQAERRQAEERRRIEAPYYKPHPQRKFSPKATKGHAAKGGYVEESSGAYGNVPPELDDNQVDLGASMDTGPKSNKSATFGASRTDSFSMTGGSSPKEDYGSLDNTMVHNGAFDNSMTNNSVGFVTDGEEDATNFDPDSPPMSPNNGHSTSRSPRSPGARSARSRRSSSGRTSEVLSGSDSGRDASGDEGSEFSEYEEGQ